MPPLKLHSWNVNGIRAALKKGFADYLDEHRPAILCIQESRALPEQVDLDLPGYTPHWHPAEKKGYSGTMILSRTEPLQVSRGLGDIREDPEGRVIAAEYDDCTVVSVYTPNAKRDLSRLEYRQRWDTDFGAYMQRLREHKPVIFCGDLNVARGPLDLTNPKRNERSHGYTIEERDGFQRFVDAGFVDTFREFTLDGGHYSWWSNWGGARERNVGWRLDYVMISPELRPRLKTATIHADVMGSDHCPVGIELD